MREVIHDLRKSVLNKKISEVRLATGQIKSRLLL